MFIFGAILAIVGIYLFFDSVRVTTDMGIIAGALGGRGGRHGGGGIGLRQTTSMGIIFVPFIISVAALFYDARMRWAWWLLYIGIAVISVEVLSMIRFRMETKLTLLLGMMFLFASGCGLMLRSYRDASGGRSTEP